MKVIGLTGGMGCGKTTVLREFQKLGVPCFIMDEEAKRLYDIPEVSEEVKNAFKDDDITDDNGNIDKKKLAEVVFRFQDKLDKLNAIIHPKVHEIFWNWVKAQSAEYVIVESAILYETGFQLNLDDIIVVYVEEDERIKRLIERDKTDIHHIRQRMIHQWPAEKKMLMADYLVLNYEGNPREKQVQIIDRNIRRSW